MSKSYFVYVSEPVQKRYGPYGEGRARQLVEDELLLDALLDREGRSYEVVEVPSDE